MQAPKTPFFSRSIVYYVKGWAIFPLGLIITNSPCKHMKLSYAS